MCTRLARALRPGRDEVSVAECDVQLRRAAGDSLRTPRRRCGPRSAAARVYAAAYVEAERRVDAAEAERLAAETREREAYVAGFEAALRKPLPERSPRSDARSERWPQVRGH